MVDRVYKRDIPRLKKELEKMKSEFAILDTKTDWVVLRIEPLLKHAESLGELLESEPESLRLTRGVSMFHSDLVYLRSNVKELEKILQTERKSHAHS